MYELPGPWENLVIRWVTYLSATGSSQQTIRARRGQVRAVARRLGAPSPDDVTHGQLVADQGRRGVGNDHRRGTRTAIMAFYAWALDEGLVAVDPTLRLPRVSESKPAPRPATDRIWADLLAAADERAALMARLACECGLRRAEVAAVHRDDLQENFDGWALIVHGKGDKQRVVPVTSQLAHAIEAYETPEGSGGYLFPRVDRWGNVSPEPISPDRVGHIVGALMPPKWSMHKLRHRFATRGFAATGNILAVSAALGHVSVATTQRYTAAARRDVRAVVDAAWQGEA